MRGQLTLPGVVYYDGQQAVADLGSEVTRAGWYLCRLKAISRGGAETTEKLDWVRVGPSTAPRCRILARYSADRREWVEVTLYLSERDGPAGRKQKRKKGGSNRRQSDVY